MLSVNDALQAGGADGRVELAASIHLNLNERAWQKTFAACWGCGVSRIPREENSFCTETKHEAFNAKASVYTLPSSQQGRRLRQSGCARMQCGMWMPLRRDGGAKLPESRLLGSIRSRCPGLDAQVRWVFSAAKAAPPEVSSAFHAYMHACTQRCTESERFLVSLHQASAESASATPAYVQSFSCQTRRLWLRGTQTDNQLTPQKKFFSETSSSRARRKASVHSLFAKAARSTRIHFLSK